MYSDKQLKQAVLDELSWEPSINAAHIGVTANEGVIDLTGHVGTYSEKFAAEAAVRRVKGVRGIAVEIEVRLHGSVKYGDEDIATAALSTLDLDVSVPKNAIRVRVEKGRLTLTGEVGWHYQMEAALKNVRGLYGVVDIANQITIKSTPNVSNISADITRALHRTWLDPKTITVTSNEGKVTLTGDVPSWHDREVAGLTAWAAPGATSVQNELRVN